MSDPAPVNVYSVTLMVTTTPQGQAASIQTQKQVNVLAATLQEAIGKAVAAVPNSEARQCSLVCVVNVQ